MQVITTQPENQLYNNAITTTLTEQSATIKNIQHTKELAINGLIKELDQRKLQFFKATHTYLAYSQQVYYEDYFKPLNVFRCKLPYIDDCYSGNQLTLVYPDETIEKIKIKPSWFSSQNIAFSSNNYAIMVLDNSEANSSLSLIKLKEFVEDSTSTNRFEINLPKENILVAGIDADNNIYTIGIENNNLCIWSSNIAFKNNANEMVNWEQLPIDLSADSISDVAFSENSRYLFVYLKTGILNVYDCNQAWHKIAEVEGTTTFPVDISEITNKNEDESINYDRYKNKKLMVFIEGKKLIIKHEAIKGKTNDTFYYENFSNKLITARFIPETKDTLIFDSAGNIHLAKYDNIVSSNCSVRRYYSTKTPYTISNVYFDSTDNTKLNVLAEKKATSLLKKTWKTTNYDCACLGTIVAPIIYCIVSGELFCCSGACWLTALYGCMGGVIFDWGDGFIDKSYFNNFIACMDIKKVITPGNYIEQKALHTIQEPIDRV
jgi:hypothetical protein